MRKGIMRQRLVLLALSLVLVGSLGGAAVATGSAKVVRASADSTTTSYGPFSPTPVRPVATRRPHPTPPPPTPAPPQAEAGSSGPHAMPGPTAAGRAAESFNAEAAPT